MTDDELADALKANFDELHDKIEALPTGVVKTRATRLLAIAHNAMNALKELAVDENTISPMSGGDPK